MAARHSANCLCGFCVRAATTEKLESSVRDVLRPDPAKLHAAKEALKHALNLLEELTEDEPECECPKCRPDLWEYSFAGGYRVKGQKEYVGHNLPTCKNSV